MDVKYTYTLFDVLLGIIALAVIIPIVFLIVGFSGYILLSVLLTLAI